jgi:uncharacterized protein YcfL
MKMIFIIIILMLVLLTGCSVDLSTSQRLNGDTDSIIICQTFCLDKNMTYDSTYSSSSDVKYSCVCYKEFYKDVK